MANQSCQQGKSALGQEPTSVVRPTTKDKEEFSSVSEVEDLYKLPRIKEKKATGKSASCDFESFKEGLYLPSALFHCFKTQGSRLPLWIFAFSKVVWSELFTAKFDVN